MNTEKADSFLTEYRSEVYRNVGIPYKEDGCEVRTALGLICGGLKKNINR
jgi:hypothetical protein